MPLILRADVDKPYGRAGLFQKIISKARENFYFPALDFLGYGKPAVLLAEYLASQNIPCVFFFRLCTLPNLYQLQLILHSGHQVGLHAEDTRSEASFLAEVERFKLALGIEKLAFFTKHGSGMLKLGRRHYAPYEEEKYRIWAERHGIRFPFGNGIITPNNWGDGDFSPAMFWLNREYRDVEKFPLEWAVEQGRARTVPIIIHPENYFAEPVVRDDIERLIKLARDAGVEWILPK